MGLKAEGIPQNIPQQRGRCRDWVIPLSGKDKEQSEKVDRISKKHNLNQDLVLTGVLAGLSGTEIVRRVGESKARGKSDFATEVFVETGEHPDEGEEREVEGSIEEAREMARRSNAIKSSPRSSDNDDRDETFGD